MNINKYFSVFYILLITAVLGVVSTYVISQKNVFEQNFYEEAVGYSYHISYDVSHATAYGDLEALQSKLQTFCNTSHKFSNIYITDEKCNIIQSTQRHDLENFTCNVKQIKELTPSSLLSTPMVRSVFYDSVKKQKINIVYELDSDLIKQQLFEIVQLPLIILFATLLLFFLIAFILVRHYFTNPLVDAENRLNESLDALNEAQKFARLGSWSLDIQKNSLSWSDEIFNIFEISKEEFQPSYKFFLSTIHPDDMGIVDAAFQQSIANKEPYDITHRIVLQNGTLKYVRERGISHYDKDGTPILAMGTVQDITKEKFQEEEFETIFKISKDGLAILDHESNFLKCNDTYVVMTGFSHEELLKTSCIGLTIPEEIEKAKEAILQVHRTGYITNFEKSCYKKDGSILTVNMSVTLMPDGKKMLISSKDVTDEKENRERLEKLLQEECSLLALFDKGNAQLFKWNNDEHWSIDYVSENVDLLMGHTKEDFLSGKVLYANCIHSDDLNHVYEEVQAALKANSDFFKHDPYRIITKNGDIRWILDYTATQKDEEGNITHFIGYLTDITDQKNHEVELKRAKDLADKANSAKSDFLASMSHEIRTPLNGIIGLTELALKTQLNRKQREYLEKSQSSSKSLLHVINDILDFSKIEAGKLDIDIQSFSFDEMMQAIQNTFDHTAEEKSLILEFDYDRKMMLEGDPLRITQVMNNLLSNALKFTKEGKIITSVETLSENDDIIELRFSVQDSGIGMSKEIQSKLFQDFTQADSSITREFGGTGLGLAISKRLVELMNGQIWIESKEGVGSTFIFTLILKKASQLEFSEQLIVDFNYSEILQGKRILIAEDNKTNQFVVMAMLEDFGVEMELANNGKEAVDMFQSKSFDLVLMDIQMPIMSGIEAAKLIREDNSEIPIIALTAGVMKEDLQRTEEAGMNAHIGKPINSHELIKKLVEVLEI